MESILHDTIVHEICSHLEINDIIHMRQLSKLFCRKISKSVIYKSIKECNDIKLEYDKQVKDQSDKINYSSKIEKFVKETVTVVGGILLSPLLLVGILVTSLYSVPLIYNICKWKIEEKKERKQYSMKYIKILSIYQKSLTDPVYIHLTKYMVNKYPELIDKICISDDLKICVTFNNYQGFEFLYGKDQKNKLPTDLLFLIKNFDRIEIWKIIEKRFNLDSTVISSFIEGYKNK